MWWIGSTLSWRAKQAKAKKFKLVELLEVKRVASFLESFTRVILKKGTGLKVTLVQDIHSKSAMGVLRGLHYKGKHAQGKPVRVTQGVMFDVAVDIRKDSATFGKWFGVDLSAENNKQIW